MDESTTNKITELLNSPDLMENVQSVLSQLTKNDSNTSSIVPSEGQDLTKMLEAFSGAFNGGGIMSSLGTILSQNKNERIALLLSLKPFLSSDKQATLDMILQLLKAANLFLAAQSLT